MTLTPVIITAVSSAIVMYIYWLEIRLLLFEKLSFRIDKQEEVGNAQYDVYLSYSDLDYLWAQQVLLNGLERKGFKVFDINRDAIDGELRSDTVEKALVSSHRVVVVFSQNLCSDADSLLTFYRAESYQQARKNKRYIVIINYDSSNNIDSDMHQRSGAYQEEGYRAFRHYLATKCYIDCHSPLFWSQLMYILPETQQPPGSMTILRRVNDQNALVTSDPSTWSHDRAPEDEDVSIEYQRLDVHHPLLN